MENDKAQLKTARHQKCGQDSTASSRRTHKDKEGISREILRHIELEVTLGGRGAGSISKRQ